MLHDKDNGLVMVNPDNYKPGKKLLMGGGQFANSFMVVNLKNIVKAINPPIPCKYQAVVEQRKYDGTTEEFTPWLASWWLAELPKILARKPIGEYTLNFDGTVLRRR